jgi:hypothetical protein
MIFIIYLLNHGFGILNFKLQALHVELSFWDFGPWVIIGLFLNEDF